MRGRWTRVAAPVAAGLALLVATSALPQIHFLEAGGGGDMQVYQRFGERMLDGELPYADFFMEYPPASVPMFLIPAALSDDFRGFAVTFRFVQAALAALALACCVATLAAAGGSQRQLYGAATAVGLSPLLLGEVIYIRYDLWAAALLAAGLLCVALERLWLGAAFVAAAATAKVYAAVLTPLLLLYVWRRRGRREAALAGAVGAAVAAAIAVPFAVIAFGGLGYSFYVHVTRPLQVESLGASILLVAHQLGVYAASVVPGLSNDLEGALPDAIAFVSALVLAAALLAVLWLFARGPARLADVLTASVAAVVAFVVFGKVLSPQFMIWLIPLVPLVARRVWPAAMAFLVAALAATNLWFPERYGDLTHLGAVAWLVLLRNVLLVALFALLLLHLARTARAYPRR